MNTGWSHVRSPWPSRTRLGVPEPSADVCPVISEGV